MGGWECMLGRNGMKKLNEPQVKENQKYPQKGSERDKMEQVVWC